MNISLTTIAYNGYGRFIPQWLAFVYSMDILPDEIVIVLGRNHQFEDLKSYRDLYPDVTFIEYNKEPNFGKLRNIAISNTTSEWIWFVSVDDKVEKHAIRHFEASLALNVIIEPSYICSQWMTIGIGKSLSIHKSPTPEEMAGYLREGKRAGFIIPHSPFKRKLWKMHHYKHTDLPNYDFLLHCVLNGGIFIKSTAPTTTYLRRYESHARAILPKIRKLALIEKKKLENGILNYYD